MKSIYSQALRDSELKHLLGEWEMHSPIFHGSPGRAVFEWAESGAYLALRSDPPDLAPASTWLIGGDDSADEYTALYTDTRGISRVYFTRMRSSVWTIWRNDSKFPQRFEGHLDENRQQLRGAWQSPGTDGNWKVDFDLSYVRVR